MKKMRMVLYVAEAVLIFLVVAASIFSFQNSREAFLSFTLAQALTLLVAVGIAFHATQHLTDERKTREQIEKIVEKIQQIVSNQDFYKFDSSGNAEQVSQNTMMKKRKLNNCIDVFESYAQDYDLEKEAVYIRQEYDAYNNLVSEKIRDLKYLSESEHALRKYSENIDSKCDFIIVKLYKNKW